MKTLLFLEGLFYFIKDALAVLSTVYILKTVLGISQRGGRGFTVLAAVLPIVYSVPVICFFGESFSQLYEFLDAVSNFYYIAAAYICLKKAPFLKVLAVVFVYIFTVDMLWSFVAEFFGYSIIAECVFNSFIFSAVFVTVRNLTAGKEKNVLSGAVKEIPRWMIFALLLFEFTCYYKEFGISAKWYDFLYAVSSCMVFVCVTALLFRIFSLIHTQNTILHRLNEQLIFSENAIRSDEELRKFRHDIKNHIIVINSMFSQGNSEGAREYFEKLSEDASYIFCEYSTGNSVVNSLLSIKKSNASDNNIKIDFSGRIPEKGIEAKDMCICVGNLLDNAIEACMLLPADEEKLISVSAGVKNNMMFIAVTNPADKQNINKDASVFKTNKKDTAKHGIGIKNVKEVAKKYGGELLLYYENGRFSAELLLGLDLQTFNE